MAHVTLDAKEISGALLSLLNRMAHAIGWVCRKRGKITFEVPDPIAPARKPHGACFSPVRPRERAEAEILLGILKRMERKVPGVPSPSGASKDSRLRNARHEPSPRRLESDTCRGASRPRRPSRGSHARDGLQSSLRVLLPTAGSGARDVAGGPGRSDPAARFLAPRSAPADAFRRRAPPRGAARPACARACPRMGAAPDGAGSPDLHERNPARRGDDPSPREPGRSRHSLLRRRGPGAGRPKSGELRDPRSPPRPAAPGPPRVLPQAPCGQGHVDLPKRPIPLGLLPLLRLTRRSGC